MGKEHWCKVAINKCRLEIKGFLLKSTASEKLFHRKQEGSKPEISS